MTAVPTEYPLSWPEAVPRTRNPGTSSFRTGLSGAMNNVRKSLQMFSTETGKAITQIVISSNFTLSTNKPADSGVAVHFIWDGSPYCIPVDRYKKIEENLQAIHHIIEADRTKLRHGGLNIVRASMSGLKALPAPQGQRPWREVLGCGLDATSSEVTAAVKRLAKLHHPDRPGGDVNRMAEINNAADRALAELSLSGA
ncbi:J domain-containing protein [Litorimonas sp. WD9-15]|uniref:J domain-containing protein n=1 Tax=Litorimonas sp. WD9-15 TaxID=3418716 RepID=UPI003D05A4E0